MAAHRRTVRVSYLASVSFEMEEGTPEGVVQEAAANLALGFLGHENYEREFPRDIPTATWVSACVDGEGLPADWAEDAADGLWEGEVDVVRRGGDYEIQDASQSGNLDAR